MLGKSVTGLFFVALSMQPGLLGCGDSRFYRIPVNTPWPDEWAAGPRPSAEAELALNNKTIAWHRGIEPETLARAVDEMLAPVPAVRHYTRLDFARAKRGGDRRVIPIVEVKIDAVLLPAPSALPGVDIDWTDEPFRERIAELAGRFGREVAFVEEFADEFPQTVSVTFSRIDPRLAFARILIAEDLFFEPVVWAPRQIRSYEYVSRSAFLAAVREAAAGVRAVVPTDTPLRILPFERWLASNPEPQRVIWQLDGEGDRDRPRRISVGLSRDPALAKKQLLRTLADRLKLTEEASASLVAPATVGATGRSADIGGQASDGL